MTNSIFLIYVSVIILITVIIIIYQNAKKYADWANFKGAFDGLGPNKTSKFLINSLNGSIMNRIPENENTPILDWKKIVPEAQILIDNFDVIKKEYQNILLNYKNIPTFGDLDDNQGGLSNFDKKEWKTFVFKYHSDYNKKNCDLCPETYKILKKLPLQLAMFSIMEKGKKLFPHRGPSKHILRLHLGIDIPKGAKITVDGKDHYWKEKELFMFDDTYEHSVDNPNGLRGILFMDLDRKLPKSYIWLINMAARSYFDKVNKEVEKNASSILN